jgi:predicted TIM-barrel fold metal-dependent hydrolase
MQPIKLKLSPDCAHLTLMLGATPAELSAHDIDRLIRDLAAVRAKMTPVHPAEPPSDPAKLHQSDNLLWSVRAAPEKSAIQFATQHPGLGWMVMALSRAQVEDLQTSFEFELAKIPESR